MDKRYCVTTLESEPVDIQASIYKAALKEACTELVKLHDVKDKDLDASKAGLELWLLCKVIDNINHTHEQLYGLVGSSD